VKPGTGVETLTNTAKEDNKKLTKKYGHLIGRNK
jgi:hypothetical protein